MKPMRASPFWLLMSLLAPSASLGESFGRLEHASGSEASPRVVVLNMYYAKRGAEADVLETRLRASRVRRELGLPIGRVLKRIDGPDSLPTVIWECEFEDITAHDRDMDARGASDDFEAARARMRTLLARFERSLWEVRSEGADRAGVPAISVLNTYYPGPEREHDVLAHRIHASDVRGSLGYAEGRVLHRLSEGDLPSVLWQMDYVDLAARERDSHGIAATPEFQEVMAKMGTLIQHFERGVYEVVREPREE